MLLFFLFFFFFKYTTYLHIEVFTNNYNFKSIFGEYKSSSGKICLKSYPLTYLKIMKTHVRSAYIDRSILFLIIIIITKN